MNHSVSADNAYSLRVEHRCAIIRVSTQVQSPHQADLRLIIYNGCRVITCLLLIVSWLQTYNPLGSSAFDSAQIVCLKFHHIFRFIATFRLSA